MKGLFIKELYSLRGTWRATLFVGGLFIIIGVIGNNQEQLVGMLSGLCIMFSIFPAIASFSQDAACGWDTFALSMPLSRKKLVRAKYLLCLGGSLLGPAIGLLICLLCGRFRDVQSRQEALTTMCVLFLTALLLQSLFLPLIYRFGLEKARLVFIGICLAPSLIGGLLAGTQPDLLENVELPSIGGPLLGISAALVLGILCLSYFLSLRFFSRKEL